jgi:hypothetical protein
MTGEIIILIRATNPVPSGWSAFPRPGGDEADHDAGQYGPDDGDVEVVGAVAVLRGLRPVV